MCWCHRWKTVRRWRVPKVGKGQDSPYVDSHGVLSLKTMRINICSTCREAEENQTVTFKNNPCLTDPVIVVTSFWESSALYLAQPSTDYQNPFSSSLCLKVYCDERGVLRTPFFALVWPSVNGYCGWRSIRIVLAFRELVFLPEKWNSNVKLLVDRTGW